MRMTTRITLLLVIFGSLFTTGVAQTPVKMRDTTFDGPQTFAMIVGISNYRYVRPLKFAHRDAELFRDYLRSPAGGSVRNDNIFCLLNEEAVNSTFWAKGFQWLKAKQLRKGDRLFLYLAGHGDAIDGDQYFFLTYDCNPGGDKNNYLAGGAIQLFNLKKKIAAESVKGVEVFLVMDACRSNELPGGPEGMNFLNTAVSEKQAGEVIMLATGAGEESLEDPSIGNGHGLFTYYLIDGLSGVADTEGEPDNKITFREIQTYISAHVPTIAEQRFKRKQAPYFCCSEFDGKVIGSVDENYLKNWLKKKKHNRGGGNSFEGDPATGTPFFPAADTALLETYNRFYAAIRKKKLNGAASAEDYLRQLDTRFPGNPYTLDARSTLAVEYINAAQEKVSQYLSCTSDPSPQEKQRLFELGNNLEKAIQLLAADEPEFAQSLSGRMYFLKSGGDFGNSDAGLQYAHRGLAAEPGSAYLENQLALLHLAAGRNDSATYYAEKAVRSAPKWRCAALTLARTKAPQQPLPLPADSSRKKNRVKSKPRFGGVTGLGFTRPTFSFTPVPNDTVRAVSMDGAVKIELGMLTQIPLGNAIDFRPSILVSFEKNKVTYSGSRSSGAPYSENVTIENVAVVAQLPFIFRLSQKNIAPYIMAGPSVNLLLQSQGAAADKFPLQDFGVLGDAGFGVDIGVARNTFVLSPEIRYTRGFTDAIEKSENSLGRVITNYTRQQFTFSLYLRKR